MPSGGAVPYHLRPNKTVERLMMVEVLGFVHEAFDLSDCAYVSMGGRALEDHRLVHERLETTNLLSFDSDETTVGRQQFNRPYPIIECRHASSAEIVDGFDQIRTELGSTGPSVVWLDYTSPKDRQLQLREVESLVSKLLSRDAVKVTMNANPDTLAERRGVSFEKYQVAAAAKLADQLGEYSPSHDLPHEKMTATGLPEILNQAIKTAVLNGLRGSGGLKVYPLSAFRYADGPHQMLALTFTVIDSADWCKLIGGRLSDWPFLASDWDDVTEIAVPDLTVKERLEIAEHVIAQPPGVFHDSLSFMLDSDPKISRQRLEQYVVHYLRCPIFLQVSV